MELCTPFTVAVPEETLVDLRDRLAGRASSTTSTGSEWTYGVSRSYLQELCEYWRTTFDWRAQEAILNAFDQFQTHVDGQPIHFIHARSTNPGALPLLLVHGWPGSIFEFVKVIGPLCDPVAHGGDEADAFHVVAPSIPGYGFSGPTIEPGWGPRRIASALRACSWSASATSATGRAAVTGGPSSRPSWRGPTRGGTCAGST